jgi:hypothetical protein
MPPSDNFRAVQEASVGVNLKANQCLGDDIQLSYELQRGKNIESRQGNHVPCNERESRQRPASDLHTNQLGDTPPEGVG